jgi:hypothetical protein
MTTEGKKDFKKGKAPLFKAEKEFKEELLAIDRVTRVTS